MQHKNACSLRREMAQIVNASMLPLVHKYNVAPGHRGSWFCAEIYNTPAVSVFCS